MQKSDSVLDDLRKSKSIHSTIVEFLDHLLEEEQTVWLSLLMSLIVAKA